MLGVAVGIERARATILERRGMTKDMDPNHIPAGTKVLHDYYKCRDRIEPKLIKSVRHYVSRFKHLILQNAEH